MLLRICSAHLGHSRPQSPRSFWSAPRIETSGRDRSRKSANHGLPAFVRSLRNLNNNGYYRLQKWAAIALARYLAPARGLDPWRRPKGSWALGTRMHLGIFEFLNKFVPYHNNIFARFMTVEKADLSKGYQNPKKIGGHHAFFRDN